MRLQEPDAREDHAQQPVRLGQALVQPEAEAQDPDLRRVGPGRLQHVDARARDQLLEPVQQELVRADVHVHVQLVREQPRPQVLLARDPLAAVVPVAVAAVVLVVAVVVAAAAAAAAVAVAVAVAVIVIVTVNIIRICCCCRRRRRRPRWVSECPGGAGWTWSCGSWRR